MFEESGGFGRSAVERVVLRKQRPRLVNEVDKKVVINVSGLRYETYESTLERFPETVLGCGERRKAFYDPIDREFFFDRNRICFESILAFYQTGGIIIRPPSIPRNVFISDIKFFDLGDDALVQAGDDLDSSQEEKRPMPSNKLMEKVWNLFEYPDTSNYARVVAIFSVCVIVLSIILFCLETLPQFQPTRIQNATDTRIVENPTKHDFFVSEAFCITWFTLEYVMRLISSPNKWKFMISVLNIIDLVAILPFFITLLLQEPGSLSSLAVLRCVRLVRVFRIFKLSRYSRGLQILGHTLKASLRELGLLFFFLVVGVILFSSAVYYAEYGYEGEDKNLFESIPHSFWWAIITMTTVGYGDMAPKTLAGKLVGMLCAITGVLAIALPVPVIVSNFAYYYSREQARQANSAPDTDDENEKENQWTLRQRVCARLICKSPEGKKKKKRKKEKNGRQYTEVQMKMDRNGEVVKAAESSDGNCSTASATKNEKENPEAIETLV